MRKALVSTIAAVALMLGASAASASPTDHLTRFTFNQPIAVPGVTLPAGTYIFKLADPTIERKIVQVLDADGSHSLLMLQATPRFRPHETGRPSLTLLETVEGMPAAIETWWPAGATIGFEFLYPERQYARLTGIPDPSIINGDGIAAMPAVATSAKSPRVRNVSHVVPAAPAQPPVTVVQTFPEPPESTASLGPAGPAAWVGVFGVLMLIGALMVGKARV